MNKEKFFPVVVCSQIIIIIILTMLIYHKRQKVLGAVSVNPIQQTSVVQSSPSLHYFYEPKPNSSEVHNPDLPVPHIPMVANNDSLYETHEYSIEKPRNTIRIITLGDSFTMGAYVNNADNWTEVLETLLNQKLLCGQKRFEVINLGVGGYDIQYSIERFKLRGEKYHPDIVVWFLIPNDFEIINELLHARELEIRKELEASGEYEKMVKEGNYYPSWVKAQDEMENKYSKQEILEKQKEFLTEFNALFEGKLVIFTLPNLEDRHKDIIRTALAKRTYGFYHEIPDIYRDSRMTFPTDGHPNELGHKVIAEDLYNYLSENNNIFCN